MSLYTLSEFMTTVKEDIGIDDLPLPVTDNDFIDRFKRSAMISFSAIHPRVVTCFLGQSELVQPQGVIMNRYHEYIIPEILYEGCSVMGVSYFQPARPDGFSDFYVPNANWSTPDAVVGAIADLRLGAGLASAMSKAPTPKFVKPNRIYVYNGWSGGTYEVELLMSHDVSLSTVPDEAIDSLRQLTVLDFKQYLYNKLRRKNNVDLGIGNIDLKIDEWSSAEQDKLALLKEWNEGGASFDYEHIMNF